MTDAALPRLGDADAGDPDVADRETGLVEAGFRFLGVDVHVFSSSVRQLQYWSAVFSAFRVAPGPDAIRIRCPAPSVPAGRGR